MLLHNPAWHFRIFRCLLISKSELSACERRRRQQKTEYPHFLHFHQKCTRCCNSRSSAWVTSGIPASEGINLLLDTSRARVVCATQLRLLGQPSGTDSHNRNVLPSSLANIHCLCYSWIFSIYFKASVKLLYAEITNPRIVASLKVEHVHQEIAKHR